MPACCLLSAVKNEGPDLLEWAVYHHLIGFDHLLVYSNDCTDGSDDLLDALAGLGWLSHRRHTPPAGVSPQDAVAALAIHDPALTRAEWAMWLDADEFLVIHAGNHRLPDLIAAAKGAEAIALNWRNFGDNGHDLTDGSLVTQRFTRGMVLENPQSRSVKTLFRRGPKIAELAIHRPIFADGSEVDLCDGRGKPLGHAFQHGRNKDNRPKHRVADGRQNWRFGQINHYPIKALDRYLLKRLRGNGLDPNCDPERFNLDYLDIFNFNEVEDTALAHYTPDLRAAIDAALSNPAVAAAFAATCEKDAARRAEVAPLVPSLAPHRYRRGGGGKDTD